MYSSQVHIGSFRICRMNSMLPLSFWEQSAIFVHYGGRQHHHRVHEQAG